MMKKTRMNKIIAEKSSNSIATEQPYIDEQESVEEEEKNNKKNIYAKTYKPTAAKKKSYK